MLNTIWSNEDVAVKEELKEDVLSNPGSPFQSSSLGNPPSSPYKIAEYHRLSPPECSQNQQYFYTTDADNNHLQTLVTLPPFPNISDSPTNQVSLDFPISTISLSEMSSSPDSSQVWVSANIDPVHDQPIKSRKRSNSGSSGSSANSCRASSGQSRPKIRRRQPLSQEEIERSRDTGTQKFNFQSKRDSRTFAGISMFHKSSINIVLQDRSAILAIFQTFQFSSFPIILNRNSI